MSIMIRKEGATHVAGYKIYFTDGGEPETGILGQGTEEEMQRLYKMMPAISYSGDRPAERAEFVIVPWSEIEAEP